MGGKRAAALALFGALILACGGPGEGSGASTWSPATGSTAATGMATTSTTATAGTTSSGTVSTGDAPTASASGSFVNVLDLPAPGEPCDPWRDSCPPGQKCKPYSDGPGPWLGASCVAIEDSPKPTGAACMDNEWSITDSCERGAVCYGFYAQSRRCHPLCSGAPMEPECPDACATCFVNGAVAGVCLQTCDPRARGCPEGQRCEVLVEGPRFACTPGPGAKAAGQACQGTGDCVDGTVCVAEALVPNCAGERCCAPVCDLDEPDVCAAALAGTACGPWPMGSPEFEPACLPAGLGLCAAG